MSVRRLRLVNASPAGPFHPGTLSIGEDVRTLTSGAYRSVLPAATTLTGDARNLVLVEFGGGHTTPLVPVCPADGGPYGEFLPDPDRGRAA